MHIVNWLVFGELISKSFDTFADAQACALKLQRLGVTYTAIES